MALNKTNRYNIRISACLASANYIALKALIKKAVADTSSISKIYEVLLQSYLFLGYPKALEGIKIFHEVIDNHNKLPRIDYSFKYWSDWKARGLVLCEKVYGKNYPKLRKRITQISPELSEWMIVEGYGKVLSRGLLAGKIRELCTVAALVVTSDINQLHSHIRGAKNLGASRDEIQKTLLLASEYCSKQKLNRSMKLYNNIFTK